MARVSPSPLLLISILDPTTQEGLVRGAFVLNQLNKTVITICTAIANQNDVEVDNITWLSFEEIKRQLDAIGRRYWIDWAILGGINDLNLAAAIVEHLHRSRPGIQILWEPSLDSTEQKTPFNPQEQLTFFSICKHVFLCVLPQTLLRTQFADYSEEELIGKLVVNNRVIITSNAPLSPHRLYCHKEHPHYCHIKNKASVNNPSAILLASLASLLYEGLDIEEACTQAFEFWESYPIN